MTDEEILKGLKACGVDGTCADCPYDTPYIPDTPPDCSERMMKDAFDLVTRQKGEVERQRNQHFVIPARCNGKTVLIKKTINAIRAEAIKEFAEKLKESLSWRTEPIDGYDIDELVKEMVGEDDT